MNLNNNIAEFKHKVSQFKPKIYSKIIKLGNNHEML